MNNDNAIKLINENGMPKEYSRIPDLWHHAQRLRDLGQDETADEILQVWHMAHDLKSVVERQGEAHITESTPAKPHPVQSNLAYVIELASHRSTMWQQYADGVDILERLSEFYECDKDEAESIAHDTRVAVDRVQDWYSKEIK